MIMNKVIEIPNQRPDFACDNFLISFIFSFVLLFFFTLIRGSSHIFLYILPDIYDFFPLDSTQYIRL